MFIPILLRPEVNNVKPYFDCEGFPLKPWSGLDAWRSMGDGQAHNSAMIYKFKSKAAGDLILLEPQGMQFLQIIGKTPGPQGIIDAPEMPAAITALQQAVQQQEAAQAQAVADAAAQGQPAPRLEGISLRQRSKPIIDMLQRCHQAGQPIVWGV
jgi:hypothetical protein